MFWKKEKGQQEPIVKATEKAIEKDILKYPYRFCILYISEKFNHILFVPQGKTEIGFHAEVDDILSDSWPCSLNQLQINIEKTLNKYQTLTEYTKGNWPSYKASKTKTQKSFELEYTGIHLETDLNQKYSDGEVERIIVTVWPNPKNTYRITETGHLVGTNISKIICDIFEATLKIKIH